MTRAEIRTAVINVLSEKTGVRASDIDDKTCLNIGRSSLGITGADADDVFNVITNRLGFQPRRFNIDEYFGPEVGWDPISAFARVFSSTNVKELKPILVEDVVKYYVENIDNC